MRVIIPITDWKDRYSAAEWLVKVEPDDKNNLDKNSAADAFQVRSVSELRFVKRIGELSIEKIVEIEKALAIVLKIETH